MPEWSIPHLGSRADCRPGHVNFSWISIPVIGRSQLTIYKHWHRCEHALLKSAELSSIRFRFRKGSTWFKDNWECQRQIMNRILFLCVWDFYWKGLGVKTSRDRFVEKVKKKKNCSYLNSTSLSADMFSALWFKNQNKTKQNRTKKTSLKLNILNAIPTNKWRCTLTRQRPENVWCNFPCWVCFGQCISGTIVTSGVCWVVLFIDELLL